MKNIYFFLHRYTVCIRRVIIITIIIIILILSCVYSFEIKFSKIASKIQRSAN